MWLALAVKWTLWVQTEHLLWVWGGRRHDVLATRRTECGKGLAEGYLCAAVWEMTVQVDIPRPSSHRWEGSPHHRYGVLSAARE